MKNIKLYLFSIIAALSLTSCYVFEMLGGGGAKVWDISMYGPMDDARGFVDSTGERRLIIFPLRIMATPKHLAYFKEYLNAKKKQGYVVYYETIKICDDGENLTTQHIDTLRRKFRRVVGCDPEEEVNYNNRHIKDEHMRNNYNLHPWIDSLGLTTVADHHLDMSLTQIIDYYERNYKAIPLSQSDFNTPLAATKYRPSDTIAHTKYYLVWEPRAKFIVDQVVTSASQKIIVVCSQDLMGYMLRPLFKRGYRSHYGYGAREDYKNLLNQSNKRCDTL